MYIDKSFQLLSADNGKLAPDETRRQDPADGDAEFDDLFGAELNSQEQQNTAGTDKKSGQEVAALMTQQIQTAEQLLKDQALAEKGLAEENLVANIVAEQTSGAELSLESGSDSKQNAATLTSNTSAEEADISQSTMADLSAEQNPWLAIINQSHDFNAILSQTAAATSINELTLTKTETLVAELLGLPVVETENVAIDATAPKAGVDTALLANVDLKAETSATTTELSGNTAAEHASSKTSLSDPALLKMVAGQADEQQQIGSPKSAAEGDNNSRSFSDKVTKLPAEQVSVQEQFKTDKPDTSSAVAATAIAYTATTAAENANVNTHASNNAETSKVVGGQTSLLQISAESVAGQLNHAESKAAKSSATTPVDIELPIVETPDEKSVSTLAAVAMTAAVTPQAKNAPQSFAQFQKVANAAAALVQKQQMQSDQMQGQPIQDLAVQQNQRVAEFNQSLSGTHPDTPISLTTLLQTERPMSAGSSMGSSTGQHQQQAASQLFAARLSDQINSNEQPALQLLEPNAATQLKERVMFQVNQKIQSAEIKLAPEELGSMQIKVQLQQEQLSVQFVVQQAGAKEALEQQMPRLREMLEEQGMQLTDGQVSQQREGADDQKQARQRHQALGQGSDIDDEPLQQQAMVRVSDRMVDYYA